MVNFAYCTCLLLVVSGLSSGGLFGAIEGKKRNILDKVQQKKAQRPYYNTSKLPCDLSCEKLAVGCPRKKCLWKEWKRPSDARAEQQFIVGGMPVSDGLQFLLFIVIDPLDPLLHNSGQIHAMCRIWSLWAKQVRRVFVVRSAETPQLCTGEHVLPGHLGSTVQDIAIPATGPRTSEPTMWKKVVEVLGPSEFEKALFAVRISMHTYFNPEALLQSREVLSVLSSTKDDYIGVRADGCTKETACKSWDSATHAQCLNFAYFVRVTALQAFANQHGRSTRWSPSWSMKCKPLSHQSASRNLLLISTKFSVAMDGGE
jgi:hypothetical protein